MKQRGFMDSHNVSNTNFKDNELQTQNRFTLRNFLNAVVKNRYDYQYMISDADFDIFKSFLDEEVELDVTYIKSKELQFKLKLLGVD